MILELTPDQEAFAEDADRFAREQIAPQAAALDETGAWPAAVLTAAAGRQLLGITVPSAAGGAGRGAVEAVLAVVGVARASGSLAFSLAIHNGLVADILARFGTDAQRQQWLGPLARGERIGAFALAEQEAGGDLTRLETTATRDGGGWRVRGRKVWVANAVARGVALVVARTADAEGVQLCAVALDGPGVARERRDAVGLRGVGYADLTLDVRMSDEQRVPRGGDAVAWAIDNGRLLMAALALGLGRASLEEVIAYGRERQAFGKAVASYQSFQWGLADAATELDSARLLTWKAAAARSRGEMTTLEAAMAKLHASDAARRAIDSAAQRLAAAGYTRGSVIDRLSRDVRGVGISQGTADLQRMAIAAELLPG